LASERHSSGSGFPAVKAASTTAAENLAFTLRLAGAAALFFLSGATSLAYETLWMKELSKLFGSSAQAAAATLSAFFLGMAAGNAYWGRRAHRLTNPLRAYALLEFGIAASASVYFAILWIYQLAYAPLFERLHETPRLFVAAKFLLACSLLFLPSFLMGGTLPVMSQFAARSKRLLGQRASLLYACNTLGAALGAFAAGFFLPHWLGISSAYLAIMAATALIAALAWLLGWQWQGRPAADLQAAPPPKASATGAPTVDSEPWGWPTLLAIGALSGFTGLGLQTLWLRMFSQTLHNSVYTFSALVAVFLVALSIGGAASRALARRAFDPRKAAIAALVLSGLLAAATPHAFYAWTDGLRYVGGSEDFWPYVGRVVGMISALVGIPVACMGVVLPYLFKLAERLREGPGECVGRLLAANTLGAILGAIAAGFVLMEWLGIWASIRLMAGLYFVAAVWLAARSRGLAAWTSAPLAGILLLLSALDASRLPAVRIDTDQRDEILVALYEGSVGTVAVTRRGGHLRTKLNNWYTLGSTGDMATQEIQTHLPFHLHPDPQSVFYLGMGTGITAGTSLGYPVERVVVSELVPSAIRAARQHFGDYLNGLFSDPRAKVVAMDGRNYLRGTRERFDVIVSDLFIPWREGVGSLYTVDHYKSALDRLEAGGLYAQWIPLYQVTEEELAVIGRSMLEAFPMVTAWRGSFWARRPVVAFVGHREAVPLSPEAGILGASRQALRLRDDPESAAIPLMAHYLGPISLRDPLFEAAPANTDNRPIIEYRSPISHRREKAGETDWFVGKRLLSFMAGQFERHHFATDPLVGDLDPGWARVIEAGYHLHLSQNLRTRGASEAAEAATRNYRGRLGEAAARLLPRP